MTESEFHILADRTLADIENALEASGLDLEFEIAAGILEIEFADGSKVIVNRQTPNREIWVAARCGGFHFRRQGDGWVDTRSGKALHVLLDEVIAQQSGSAAGLRW